MSKIISSYQELRAEIQVLRAKRAESELFFFQKKEKLKAMLSSPLKFISVVKSALGIGKAGPADPDAPLKSDWATALGRVFFPLLLNKTLLRGNNMIVKSLIALISQKTVNAQSFNKEKLAGWVDGLTHWINKTLKKPKKTRDVDYGIPPDSESY